MPPGTRPRMDRRRTLRRRLRATAYGDVTSFYRPSPSPRPRPRPRLRPRLRPRHRPRARPRPRPSPSPSPRTRPREWSQVSVRVERLSLLCLQFPSLQPTVRLTRISPSHREAGSSHSGGSMFSPSPESQRGRHHKPMGQSPSPEEVTSSAAFRPEPGPDPDLKPTLVLLDSEWRTFYLDPDPELIVRLNHRPEPGVNNGILPGLRPRPDPEPDCLIFENEPKLDPDLIIRLNQGPGREPELEPEQGEDPELIMRLNYGLGPGLEHRPKPEEDLDLFIQLNHESEHGLRPGLGPKLDTEPDLFIHGQEPERDSDPQLDEHLVLDGSQSEVLLLVHDTKVNVIQGLHHGLRNNVFKNENTSESIENSPNIKIEVEDFIEDSPDVSTDELMDEVELNDLGFKVDFIGEQTLNVDWIEVKDLTMNGPGDDEHIKDFKGDHADSGSDDSRGALKVDRSEDQHRADILKLNRTKEKPLKANHVEDKSLKTHLIEDQDNTEALKVDWEDFCAVCSNGGELLCCEHCPKVYHLNCHVPAMIAVPGGDWVCSLCRPDHDPDMEQDETQDSALFRRSLVPYFLSPQDQRRCERLTLQLLTHHLSAPFHLPVSPQVRHYYQIVRRPVDLSSVRRKLDCRNTPRYFSPEQFVDDILLMFHNCATFNYPDSEVAEAGLKLKKFFLLNLKEVFPGRTFLSANQSTADRKSCLKWKQRRRSKFYNVYLK